METNWTSIPLAECGTWLSGGTPSKSRLEYWHGDIPWVSPKDMNEHFIRDAQDHLSSEGVDNGSKLIPPYTILFVVRSMTLAHKFQIAITERTVAFNQDLKAIVCKEAIYPYFLFYSLLSQSNTILQLVDEASHGTKRLRTDVLKKINIHLPSFEEQRTIAQFFKALDDKIELNRQMNETLEGIARALFKSWFVDFDPVRAKREGRQPYGMDAETAALFPEGFEDSALGEIPRGWRIAKFTDFIKIFKKSVIPNQQLNEIFDHYSIPAFDKERLPTFERGEQIMSNKFLVPEGAILLSKINPTIPRVWFPFIGANEHRSICSTEFLVILPKEAMLSEFLYTLFSTNDFQERFIALTTGSSNSHQRVGSNELLNMNLLIPSLTLIEHFTQVARPLYIMMNQNLGESKTLTALRDTLLPKLLSGELRIGEAEKEVGAML